jgi:hypothetical protein
LEDQQQAEIEARMITPAMDGEAAILADLSPGPYTAVVAGKASSGVRLIES